MGFVRAFARKKKIPEDKGNSTTEGRIDFALRGCEESVLRCKTGSYLFEVFMDNIKYYPEHADKEDQHEPTYDDHWHLICFC